MVYWIWFANIFSKRFKIIIKDIELYCLIITYSMLRVSLYCLLMKTNSPVAREPVKLSCKKLLIFSTLWYIKWWEAMTFKIKGFFLNFLACNLKATFSPSFLYSFHFDVRRNHFDFLLPQNTILDAFINFSFTHEHKIISMRLWHFTSVYMKRYTFYSFFS